MWASDEGHGAIVDSLIRAGANLDIVDANRGYTALMHALDEFPHGGDKKKVNESIVESLVRGGARLDVKTHPNDGGMNIFHLECSDKMYKYLKLHYRTQCYNGLDPTPPHIV